MQEEVAYKEYCEERDRNSKQMVELIVDRAISEIHAKCLEERSEQVNQIIDLLIDEGAKIGQANIDSREE